MAVGSLLATLRAGLWHCSLRDASNFRMDSERIFRPYTCYTDRNDINEIRKSSKSRSPQRQGRAELVALNSWLRKKWSMNPLERDGGRETKENARQRMPVGRNSQPQLPSAPLCTLCAPLQLLGHRRPSSSTTNHSASAHPLCDRDCASLASSLWSWTRSIMVRTAHSL